MISALSFFGAGILSKAKCDALVPCRPSVTCRVQRPFKLSFCIHTATLASVDGNKIPAGKRPYISVTVGNKTKDTELADWCAEDGIWLFKEVITLEVCQEDEVVISIVCQQQYSLVVAAVKVSDRYMGQVCVPVASVVPSMKPEDRDFDGVMYVTPNINFDLLKEGSKIGRAVISFEAKNLPQQLANLATEMVIDKD